MLVLLNLDPVTTKLHRLVMLCAILGIWLGPLGSFSYISGLSTKDDPGTPVVLTRLIPGNTTFDPKPFKGKAIVLHVDHSVRSYNIKKDGHIYRNGIELLSTKHPIWKGKAPDIRYPDL